MNQALVPVPFISVSNIQIHPEVQEIKAASIIKGVSKSDISTFGRAKQITNRVGFNTIRHRTKKESNMLVKSKGDLKEKPVKKRSKRVLSKLPKVSNKVVMRVRQVSKINDVP